jgi:hypothetical protein
MSSHFNYEIDERSLRGKLKDLSFPYSEEAWSSYDAFSEASKKTYKAPVLPTVRLNLNRNIILPVVFGAVIILFSMLLFNFISIKKTTETKAAKAPEQIPVQPKPEPKQLVVQKIEPAIDTTKKIIATDTVKAAARSQETIAAIQPPAKPQPTVTAVPVPTVQQQTQAINSPAWTVIESGDIYIDPNIKSQVIGTSKRNQTYQALEETVYFIKIGFNNNGIPAVGFILKSRVSRNGSASSGTTVQRRNRKPEVLESMQAPAVLPTGSAEKEPELK